MRLLRSRLGSSMIGYVAAIISASAVFVMVPILTDMFLHASGARDALYFSLLGTATLSVVALPALLVPFLLIRWGAIRFGMFHFRYFLTWALLVAFVAACLLTAPSEAYEPVHHTYTENLIRNLPRVVLSAVAAAVTFWRIAGRKSHAVK